VASADGGTKTAEGVRGRSRALSTYPVRHDLRNDPLGRSNRAAVRPHDDDGRRVHIVDRRPAHRGVPRPHKSPDEDETAPSGDGVALNERAGGSGARRHRRGRDFELGDRLT